MAGTIKLPLAGEVKKSTALIGGGAIVAIVGYVYIRNRRAKNATGTVTDPAGNVCSALDAQSGYCPGSPEDAQFKQQQSAGTGGFGGGYGGGGGPGFVTDAQGNQCIALDPATGLCPVGSTTGSTAITTNAQWVQEAERLLGNTPQVQAALGYALSGQPVTQAQKLIFEEAIGLTGMSPPQGYPPLNVVGGTHHPPPKNRVSVPNTIGERLEAATDIIQAAGLKAKHGFTRPGVGYIVTGSSPKAGTEVTSGSTVHLSIRPVGSGAGQKNPLPESIKA